MQRCEQQPDEYTSALNMAAPLHVSATWSSISELFVHVSIPLLNLYSFVQLTDYSWLSLPLIHQLLSQSKMTNPLTGPTFTLRWAWF